MSASLLVVGDVDERDPDLLLDLLELDLHVLAELEVERAERLVEEQHPRAVDERASERDPLPLAARQLVRLALLIAGQAHHAQGLRDPLAACRLVDLADHQPVAHVVADRHVREQRVVLEDRVDVALERRDAGHVTPVKDDAAARRLLEPGDHPERRRLAGPRRAKHREELAIAHVEVDAGDGDHVAVPLLNSFEPDRDGRLGRFGR